MRWRWRGSLPKIHTSCRQRRSVFGLGTRSTRRRTRLAPLKVIKLESDDESADDDESEEFNASERRSWRSGTLSTQRLMITMTSSMWIGVLCFKLCLNV